MPENNILFDKRDIKIKINDNVMEIYNLEMKSESEVNKHSSLNVEFNIPEGYAEDYNNFLDETDVKIAVELVKEDVNRILFIGFIKKIEIKKRNGAYYIKIFAFSISELLDREKKFKSYQDSQTNYQEIFDYTTSNYENELVNIVGESLSSMIQSELLIQNGETDWEFINRICSKYEKPVLNIGTGMRVGFNSNSREGTVDTANSIIWLNRDKNEKFIEYYIECYDFFSVGEKITIDLNNRNDTCIVIKNEYIIRGNALTCLYKLVKEGDYTRDYYRSENIAGKAIEGKIVEVLDVDGIAKMTVNFNTSLVRTGEMIEDENGNSSEATTEEQLGSELFKFPYVTPYSQSHTGYFCTPEVNDNVVIYFPTEKESDGFVMGTVNSAGNGRFTDRFNRNFIIPAEGSENGEGIDDPQYNMTLANNVFGVTTGTTNTEVEYENLTVSEDSVTTVSNDKSVTVENDMNYTITNNKNVQVDNNLNYTVSNDYQADVNNYKISANANVEAQGTSAVNIKGMEVKVEADTQANLKGGAMVQVGAPQVSIGS